MNDIRVGIAGNYRNIGEADASWITEQIRRRRADGQAVCVEVVIHVDGILMTLSTPTCRSERGGYRLPNPREREILELSRKHHLVARDFSTGGVVLFVKQLQHMF